MKKLLVLAAIAVVLTVFNSCKKDELKTTPDEGIAKTSKADVYLENGYLAFKNMDVVDSVINVLSQMNRKGKDAWEQKIGLKSARYEFDILFDEYEKLTSKEDFLKFKGKYSDRLKFNEIDETDCSINYPYESSYYASVMNNKGIFKVGISLFQYTKEKQIIVLDGDMNKLKNLSAYSNDKNIIGYTKLKDGSINQTDLLADFAAFDPSPNSNSWWINYGYGSDRKLLNELKVDKWVYWTTVKVSAPYSTLKTTVTKGYRIYLRQYGLKKGTFGWNSYWTSYICQNLVCQVNASTKFTVTGIPSESPEVKPVYIWDIKRFEITTEYLMSSGDQTYYPTPPVSMEADLSCRGFNGRLTNVSYNTPFLITY